MKITNRHIASAIKLGGQLLELHGENSFKTKAYEIAAQKIKLLAVPLSTLTETEIEKQDGLGKSMAAKIFSICQSGTYPDLSKLIEATPKGIFQLIKIKGISSSKARTMWVEAGIQSPQDALDACKENRLETLKGFGAKTQASIQDALEHYFESAGKVLYIQAEEEVDEILEKLLDSGKVKRAEATGAYRRREILIEQIDILVENDNPLSMDEMSEISGLEMMNDTVFKSSAFELPVRFLFAGPESFTRILLETTGTEKHLSSLKFSEKNYIDEREIYTENHLPFIIPEMRNGNGEFEWMKHWGEDEIINEHHIRGAIHNHSTYSDGAKSISLMADYCRQKGYEYFGISDHSQTAFYANGLKPKDVFRQWNEIDELNATYHNFTVLKGIESDILGDGSLDYEDEILQRFDYVVASIHSNLNMTEEAATKRLIKAVENPYTNILGHMTGRLLLQRRGYPVNHKKIIDACAANGVIMELNANPLRLDIDHTWLPYCMEKEVMISINPDAHDDVQIDYIKYGVLAARKAGIPSEKVLNTFSLPAIREVFSRKKSLTTAR